MMKCFMTLVVVSMVAAAGSAARADVGMEWVTVGDPGNTGEVSGGRCRWDRPNSNLWRRR
ncbi:unnamed protein product, partial [marine sediment metagenome]